MKRLVDGGESHRVQAPASRTAWQRLMVAIVVGLLGPGIQAAPTVTSVIPANGATGVSVTQTLSFTFSEAMDDSIVPIPSFPPFLIGNLDLTPTSVFQDLSCEWSEDARTLDCTVDGELPANTTIAWKINPAGATLPLASAGGAAVATTSGSFTTGASGGGGGGGGETAPTLNASNPADGATGVPVTTTVTFVFDTAMTPNPQIGGVPPLVKGAIAWSGPGVDASKFSYSWSPDHRTLICDYAGDLPGSTQVGWTLNPDGSAFSLTSEADQIALETISGRFTTGAGGSGGGGGGEEDCYEGEPPDDWGSYGLSKGAQYVQSSSADPVLDSESLPNAGVIVMAPTTEASITAGTVAFPGGTTKPLTKMPFSNALMLTEEFPTVAALDSGYPAGTYTLRFQQTGQPERVVPMNVPAANPPVPKVTNYDAAQNVDPATAFTLSWTPFSGASAASDSLSLVIIDGMKVIFSAPNPCIPRELPVSATQIAIPAGTLAASKVYQATLTFNRTFLYTTNTIPKMSGYGGITRTTNFRIATQGAVLPPDAPRFTGFRLVDGKPELTLTGSAGRAYTIERASSPLGPWSQAGTAAIGNAGTGVFVDPNSGPFPVYYRAFGI